MCHACHAWHPPVQRRLGSWPPKRSGGRASLRCLVWAGLVTLLILVWHFKIRPMHRTSPELGEDSVHHDADSPVASRGRYTRPSIVSIMRLERKMASDGPAAKHRSTEDADGIQHLTSSVARAQKLGVLMSPDELSCLLQVPNDIGSAPSQDHQGVERTPRRGGIRFHGSP